MRYSNAPYINALGWSILAKNANFISDNELIEFKRFHRKYRKHFVHTCNWYKNDWMPLSVFRVMYKIHKFTHSSLYMT